METQNSKYVRKAYGIGSIILLLLYLYFYNALSFSIYGILPIIMQFASCYCLLKAHESINVQSIIRSTVIPTLCLFVIYIIGLFTSMVLDYNAWFQMPVYISFNVALCLLTACLFLCIALIGYQNKDAYIKAKHITRIAAFVSLSIILSIAVIENINGRFDPNMLFVIGLLFTQGFCCYNLYKLSSKWFYIGNLVFALFLVSLQMNMLAYHNDLLRNTGWALTYIAFVLGEMLAMHLSFAALISLIPNLYPKLFKNKEQKEFLLSKN